MANPNISLLGATYSGVAGVTLPKQGGGTATFPWVEGSQTITTNNTYDVTNLASVVVNVSGGGASNIVTGTFKGTTTNAAMSVTLPYTGSGYPIAVMVYPTEGAFNTGGTYYSTLQRYAACCFFGIKNYPLLTPTYPKSGTSDENTARVTVVYKSSSSTAYSLTQSGTNNTMLFWGNASSASQYLHLRFTDHKTMSVFIASTSYGFMKNIEYKYCVVYSS